MPGVALAPLVNRVSSAFYARMARIAADVARALGDQASAAKYDALFGKITTDFNARFLGKDGIYREKRDEPFLQTAKSCRSPSTWSRRRSAPPSPSGSRGTS